MGLSSKIPQIRWFKAMEMCCLLVWEARSLKSGCQLGHVLTEVPKKETSLPLLALVEPGSSLAVAT